MKILPLVALPTFLAVGAAITACAAQGGDGTTVAIDSNLGAASGSGLPTTSGAGPTPEGSCVGPLPPASSGDAPAPPASSGWYPIPSASGSYDPAPYPSGSYPIPYPSGSYQPPPPPPPFEWTSTCPAAPPPSEPRPLPTGDVEDLRDYLDAVRSDLAGHWVGITTTPWSPPYSVHVAFDSDGHYATRSDDLYFPAFYWGTDFDTPLKQWSLDDISVYGVASGWLDIPYDNGYGQLTLTGWGGALHDLKVDASGQRAQFGLSTADGYGGVHVDLWRCE